MFSSVLHVLSAYSRSRGNPFADSFESAIMMFIASLSLDTGHSARYGLFPVLYMQSSISSP